MEMKYNIFKDRDKELAITRIIIPQNRNKMKKHKSISNGKA